MCSLPHPTRKPVAAQGEGCERLWCQVALVADNNSCLVCVADPLALRLPFQRFPQTPRVHVGARDVLQLADLLASCPELTLLVTSRKSLRLRSEHLLMYRLSRLKSEEELQIEVARSVSQSIRRCRKNQTSSSRWRLKLAAIYHLGGCEPQAKVRADARQAHVESQLLNEKWVGAAQDLVPLQ